MANPSTTIKAQTPTNTQPASTQPAPTLPTKNLSNKRHRQVIFNGTSQTIKFDTLSLVPSTIKLTDTHGNEIDTSKYSIDPINATVYLKSTPPTSTLNSTPTLPNSSSTPPTSPTSSSTSSSTPTTANSHQPINSPPDTLILTYRVFPFSLSTVVSHKSLDRINTSPDAPYNPFLYTLDRPVVDPFKTEGLNKSGSLSRGISFGSNQDLVVNSNLNLQVSGKLTDNIDILLSATDNTIPIQASGTTQQLQDFDKVFIQLSDKTSKLIAGDFQIGNGAGYFLRFNKKAQGATFSTLINLNPSLIPPNLPNQNPNQNPTLNSTQYSNASKPDSSKMQLLKITASAALSKGKYGNNLIQGQEGNQGPYFLTGSAGEQYIVILSGSEKVYIDGQLLIRGQENDYTIDYNTAQIRFTAKQLITKDKRIEIQFQYATTAYSRSMFHTAIEYQHGPLALRFNAYDEQDNKNNPLQQSLSDSDKVKLALAGNDMTKAYKSGVDSIHFNTTDILYQKRDTTIGSNTYKGIYSYSTDSTKAHYRLQFSQVAQGNYIQINAAANGKVYQWVAPINGIPQGNYEPIIPLIAPMAKQLVTFGGNYKIATTTVLTFETALSNTNQNTLSQLDKANDVGYAFQFGVKDSRLFKPSNDTTKKAVQSWKLVSDFNYDYTQQNFSPIETFRAIEFQRDWNLSSLNLAADQHLVGGGITLARPGLLTVGYNATSLLQGSAYTGFRQTALLNFQKMGYNLTADGSLTNTQGIKETTFLRQKAQLTKKIKRFTIGINEQQEHNLWRIRGADSILTNSAAFQEWTTFITNADTAKLKYNLSYKQRLDYGPTPFNLKPATFAKEAASKVSWNKKKNNQLSLTATYRQLQIIDTLLHGIKPDHILLGRLEHNFSLPQGLLTTNTFFEVGAGQEVKQQFSYLQVPAGQGVYTWTDYNHDGIQELNEFDVAVYKDQANYIRIYTPTNQTIGVYTNQFSETVNLRPAAAWSQKKDCRKILSHFSNQTSYRIDKKTSDDDLLHAYNPFYNTKTDTLLRSLNSTMRNTFSVEPLNPIWGLDFTYQDNRSRTLNADGLDTRIAILKEMRVHWNITRKINISCALNSGEKYSNSQFFSDRDYDVFYNGLEPKFSFQPNNSFRITLLAKIVYKENTPNLGGQFCNQQTYGLECKYSVQKRGNLTAKFNTINLVFNGDPSSPLAYEMLEALHPGENLTWTIGYQQSLSNNMTISLNYDGRKSPGINLVNTGTAQVRASF